MRYLLVDNGSLKAESILNHRRIARELGKMAGLEIIPASLLHSSKVDPEQLEGEPAVNLERRLRWLLEAGEREFTIIPFFIGPSAAIVDYFPQRLAKLRKRFGNFFIQRTGFLFDPLSARQLASLESILADNVRSTITANALKRPNVILVDHGSPLKEVTAVRNELANRLSLELEGEIDDLLAASMERREGDAYAFNEPLLEKVLRRKGWSRGPIVVAMLFLSPGRHAGKNGDIEQICRTARLDNPEFQTYISGLLGSHPGIIPILNQRLKGTLVRL